MGMCRQPVSGELKLANYVAAVLGRPWVNMEGGRVEGGLQVRPH